MPVRSRPRVGRIPLWDANTNMGRVAPCRGRRHSGHDLPVAGFRLARRRCRQDGFNPNPNRRLSSCSSTSLQTGRRSRCQFRVTPTRRSRASWDADQHLYAYGGPQLLVETVEKLTGLTVKSLRPDRHGCGAGHGGRRRQRRAVLRQRRGRPILRPEVERRRCHTVDGTTALRFSRMRYWDPGDIPAARSVNAR